MSDPHLDPIVTTWDTKTLEDVREALQHIPALKYQCEYCGSQFNSPSAQIACELDCEDMTPRD